jgi:hypothetical protein
MSRFLATEQEILLHRQQGLWSNDNSLTEDMLYLINPHGEPYHSKFTAFYLFEVKSLKHLSYFNSILVRDGLLPLLKFFFDQPAPKNFSSSLLIHEDLAYLTPKAWQEQVYYYRYASSLNKSSSENNIVLSFGVLDSYTCPLDRLNYLLNTVKWDKVKQLYGLYNLPYPQTDTELHQFDGHYLKVIESLRAHCPVIEPTNWRQCQGLPLSQVSLIDLNLTKFWYADSYVEFFLRSRGAKLLEQDKSAPNNILFSHELSPHHKIEIFKTPSKTQLIQASNLYSEIERLRPSVLHEEEKFPREVGDSSKLELCSPELKRIALALLEGRFE